MRIFLIISLASFLTSCGYINQKLGLKDDNIGEELIEQVIENQTGINADLTPESKEK